MLSIHFLTGFVSFSQKSAKYSTHPRPIPQCCHYPEHKPSTKPINGQILQQRRHRAALPRGIPSFAISPQIVLTQSQRRAAVWNCSASVPSRADQPRTFTSSSSAAFSHEGEIKECAESLGERFDATAFVLALRFPTIVLVGTS